MSTQDPASDAGHFPDTGVNGNTNGNSNGALTTIEHRLPAVAPVGWINGAQGRPDILSAKPNPVELLHAFRRRWPLATGLGLVVSCLLAGLVWYLVPVKYEAYALLKVSGKTQSVLPTGHGGGEDFSVFKRTQIQLILSNVVLLNTVREPEITRLSVMQEHNEDQSAWLKGQLLIDYPDDAELLRVAMKAKEPGDAIKIVDMVVKKYMKEIVQHEREVRDVNELKLRVTYDKFVNEGKTLEDTLHKLEVLNQTSSTEVAQVKKRLALAKLGDKMDQSRSLMAQLAHGEQETKLLEARKESADELQPPDSVIELELNRDSMVSRGNDELSAMNEALADAISRSHNPEKSKTIQRWKEKIQRIEERVEERKAHLKPKILDALSGRAMSGGQLSLPLLAKQKVYLEAMLQEAEDEVKAQANVVSALDQFNATVTAQHEELRAKKKITSDLRAQLDSLNVERLAPERITEVDAATLANSSGDAMRKYIAVAFAWFLGLGGVIVGVAFVEFQSRKVNSVEEVNEGLGIRVMGELPNVSGRAWRRLKGGKGPAVLKALMAERIDGTRTNLIHTTSIASPRSVMVTSAEPHEGKTTTASQLAASLARSGRRTLLVDADIRNPGAHRIFEMPQEPGLCELLRGESERDAVVQPTRTTNLWLLPAGHCDLRSVQAMSTAYLGTIIAGLRAQFDYVVIDSGPLLKVADSLMVGQHVDAAIVSVLRDVSTVPNVYQACERLRCVGITVLGAVVNGVNDDVARHGVELLIAETKSA